MVQGTVVKWFAAVVTNVKWKATNSPHKKRFPGRKMLKHRAF